MSSGKKQADRDHHEGDEIRRQFPPCSCQILSRQFEVGRRWCSNAGAALGSDHSIRTAGP